MFDALPALLSAVAAFFAAVTSFVLLRIQRRDSQESVRPELVIDGWKRGDVGSGDQIREEIGIGEVRNVGRGAAFHVLLLLEVPAFSFEEPTKALMGGTSVPIVASGEKMEIDCRIDVWWKNVSATMNEVRYLSMTILIFYWDRHGMRHETRYNLFANEPGHQGVVGGAIEVAPGLSLTSRITISRSVWLIKARRRFTRVKSRLGRIWKIR